MLLFDAPLTFREFMTKEELPLATLFRDVLTFLQGRDDSVLFGAQAVNAWCEPPRMTADVDVMSTRAEALAEELAERLAGTFHVAVRVREVVPGGFRVYQLRKPKNRHLVDVRQVAVLPSHRAVEGVAVVVPAELAAMKVLAMVRRAGQPKALSDELDLRRLLLAFSDLRVPDGAVADRLAALHADDAALATWRELVSKPIGDDEDEGY